MAGNHLSKRNDDGQYVALYDWPEVVEALCEHIAEGGTLRRFCAQPGHPTVRWVWEALNRPGNEALKAKYIAAQTLKAETIEDRYEEVAESVKAGDLDPRAGRVMLDAYTRQRAQLDARFNDARAKYQMEVTHSLDIADTMNRAFERALDRERAEKAKVIDVSGDESRKAEPLPEVQYVTDITPRGAYRRVP